jgi:hypothetical protein
MGLRCDNGACKFDPTPRCYNASEGVCMEGEWSDTWMEDCKDDDGEIVTSCPAEGRRGTCRYKTDDNKPIAVYVYTSAAVSAARDNCGLLKSGVYTSGSGS